MKKNEIKNLMKANGETCVVYKYYRFPLTSTIEELQVDSGSNEAVLQYENKVIFAGMNYKGETLAAIYEAKEAGNFTIESEIELTEIADQTFEDNGHAVAWTIGQMN